MAKANEVKKAIKLTKNELDNKILEYLKTDQEIKNLSSKLKDLKIELESQYKLNANEKETIKGNLTYMEKIPVNNGKNNYNVDLLKPFLKAIKKFSAVIKKIEVVDTAQLDSLVKNGQLAPEVLETCRISNWTFKSTFKRIEAEAEAAKNDKKVI